MDTTGHAELLESSGIPSLVLLEDSLGNSWQLGANAVSDTEAEFTLTKVPTHIATGWGIPVISQYGSGAYGAEPIETLQLDYYLNLVTSQYRNSPKFLAWLRFLLQKLQDISQCQIQMSQAFDVDNAQGVQLDVLGSIVGASRTVGFQPSGGVSPVLNDATYRLLIKAVAAQNTWDGTIDGLQSVWENLFPEGTITIGDNQNMTATIFLTGTFTSIQKDLIVNGYIVPRPQAVRYQYVFNLPAFGCDLRNKWVAGADQGYTV